MCAPDCPRSKPWTRRFCSPISPHKSVPALIAIVRLLQAFPPRCLGVLTPSVTRRLGLFRRLVSPVDELIFRCLRVHHSIVSPSQGIGRKVAGRTLAHLALLTDEMTHYFIDVRDDRQSAECRCSNAFCQGHSYIAAVVAFDA